MVLLNRITKPAVLTVISALLFSCSTKKGKTTILCYVGGTMRPAVEQCAKAYEQKTGTKVLVDYSSSGEAMIKARESGRGDLIVVHDPYLGAIMKEGLGTKGWTVATLKGVITVPRGNPLGIKGLGDLARPGMRLVLSDPVYSTLGNIIRVLGQKSGITEQLKTNVVTRTKGSAEAANAVSIGTADAAIVWNAVAHLRSDKLDIVPIEERYNPLPGIDALTTATFGLIDMSITRVTVSLLRSSNVPQEAEKFAAFMASAEGALIWAAQGYSSVPENNPYGNSSTGAIDGSILVHCAAGMRPPIEKLAQMFERDRGVKVALTYDGSNRLLGQIELTRKGDLYITGDADYLDLARQKGLTATGKTICFFIPVIMVQKGNPHHVKGLSDLLKPEMKLGQGDEKAAAVGRLTPGILQANGIDRLAWKKNVKLVTPTVNELGSAIKLGTIDAAIVWNAIANSYKEDAEVVSLEPSKNIFPEVGGAVLTMASNPDAAEAFLSYLGSPAGKEVLKGYGYSTEKP